MARTRLWSYTTPDAEAYIEVDVVADEAVSAHWFNSTGRPVTVTFQWKNLPQPTVVEIPPATLGEQSIGIPPGQRKWIVIPGADDDTLDAEFSALTVEAG
jgi:hypothetical protein